MKIPEKPELVVIHLEEAPRFVSAMQILFNALWEQGKPEPQTKEGA
jgi:hypothetical protein